MAGVPRNGMATHAQRRCILRRVFWNADAHPPTPGRRKPMTALLDDDVRTEALFASHLQRSQRPTPESVRAAVLAALERLGAGGCAELVAQEFGEHPDCALGRMQWARLAIRDAFGGPASAR
jgi:hypothetical protein